MNMGSSVDDTGDVYHTITISGGTVGAIGGRGHHVEQTVGRGVDAPGDASAGQGTRPVAAVPAGELAAIRDLLLEAFSAPDLRRLFAYTPNLVLQPAIHEFAEGDGPADLADKAIRFCQTRGLLPDLLAEVAQARPRQYAAYQERLQRPGEQE